MFLKSLIVPLFRWGIDSETTEVSVGFLSLCAFAIRKRRIETDFEAEEQQAMEQQQVTDEIMAGLTPEEQQAVAQDPSLLDGIMQNVNTRTELEGVGL